MLTRFPNRRDVLDAVAYSREIANAYASTGLEIKERLLALGADPARTAPEGFDAYIGAEVAKFRKIVQDAGIKPE